MQAEEGDMVIRRYDSKVGAVVMSRSRGLTALHLQWCHASGTGGPVRPCGSAVAGEGVRWAKLTG